MPLRGGVCQEDDVRSHSVSSDEVGPFFDHGLARHVGRMSHARGHQSHAAFFVAWQAFEAVLSPI
jgi:hypothetical protein